MRLSPEDAKVVGDNAEILAEFRAFCETKGQGKGLTEEELDYCGSQPFEEINFYDLSLGFFIAKGCDLALAFKLAIISRYEFQYWC